MLWREARRPKGKWCEFAESADVVEEFQATFWAIWVDLVLTVFDVMMTR